MIRRSILAAGLFILGGTACAADALIDNPVGYSTDAVDLAKKQARQHQEATRVFKPKGISTEEVKAMQGLDPGAIAARYNSSIASMMPPANELYVLVSEKMPFDSLMRLAKQTGKAGGTMVFRGVKGGVSEGAFERFAEYSEKFAKQGVVIHIDPTVFRRFQVNVVPTVVLTTSIEGCNQTEACQYNADMVAGDVSLDYALDHLSRKESPMAAIAAMFLARLKQDSLR